MSGFRKLGEREIHQGHVVSMAVGTFEVPDGSTIERDLVHHPGAVNVVPIIDGEAVLVRQFRAAVNDHLLEIPAGKRDHGDELPELTAHRELEEEVGMRAGRLVHLATFFNSPGFCDELTYSYLATDLSPAERDVQGPEEAHMTIERVRLVDVPGLIASGEIRDAKTIIGLTLAIQRSED